jgi:hypothetical protein
MLTERHILPLSTVLHADCQPKTLISLCCVLNQLTPTVSKERRKIMRRKIKSEIKDYPTIKELAERLHEAIEKADYRNLYLACIVLDCLEDDEEANGNDQ